MPETLERAQARLQNITIVKPLLEALRTISLGSWQASQRALRFSEDYRGRLFMMLPSIVAHLKTSNHFEEQDETGARGLLVVIGSERGLCGNFNRVLVRKASERLSELASGSNDIPTHVFGRGVWRAIHREYGNEWKCNVHSMPSVPPSKMAGEWSAAWLNDYDLGSLDWVEVIFNENSGTTAYTTKITRILPFHLPEMDPQPENWPDPILDTDPTNLFISLIRQLAALDLFRILLVSSIAEHTSRYQLMEEASKNADSLIDELTLDVQAARRQAITQEMEELAVGAGLL